ncbi:Hypothetical protein BROD_0865 [Brucella sp. NF 2653]|uniref:hypothetical protein n=1 Tax=unclassified Brucella TaxID=2632610 RepID=UPI0001BD8068|nr:predicted protein [Brucella sp. 83/13]EFM63016.1 Hypothetical protein BROD_0865 [Brucella sp. NF 2653]
MSHRTIFLPKMAHPDTLDGPALLILSIAKTRMGAYPVYPPYRLGNTVNGEVRVCHRAPLGASDQLIVRRIAGYDCNTPQHRWSMIRPG